MLSARRMMNKKTETAISKAMSHALRHDPGAYGLAPDSQGWVTADDLVTALTGRGGLPALDAAAIAHVVASSDKQRFELADGRVRARYGHSLGERVDHAAAVPPEILYHGTARRFVAAILAEGLRPMARQHVHLSATEELATIVGRRRDADPAILTVAARVAHDAGVVFHDAGNGVWLSGPLPAAFVAP